ncbi:MAG: hypothetical protein H6Q67_2302 [Firmicutes bacterium]|nr:hypothetical protein [Bacillota bacterium]
MHVILWHYAGKIILFAEFRCKNGKRGAADAI